MLTEAVSFPGLRCAFVAWMCFALGCSVIRSPIRFDPAYSSLAEEIPAVDLKRLEGRIIVIDPGHGFGFPGAVGKGGLREADVNMWVSLYLARMLRSYGAKVILTRAGEGGPAGEEGETLKENLLERVELANDLRADLFLSIHHNSSLESRPTYNAVETYYKMGDEGPSLEAGRAIHEHLSANLGISDAYLAPGNYFILRHSQRPAILGEASYISNPKMAKKLVEREKLSLEAQAYLLGILDYFSRGRPVIQSQFPPGDTTYTPFPDISATILPGTDGSPVDPSSVSMTIDGVEVSTGGYRYDGMDLHYLPSSPLASGTHLLEWRARNLSGNSAIPLHRDITVILPASTIEVRLHPRVIPPGERSLILVEAFVRDEAGGPVVDGKEVEIRAVGKRSETWIRRTEGGRVSLLYPAREPGAVTFSIHSDQVEVERILDVGKQDEGLVIVILRDGRTDVPIAGASVTLAHGAERQVTATSPEGFAQFSAELDGICELNVQRKGYRPYTEQISVERGEVERSDLGLNPIQNGALMGKVIALDPDHPGRDDPLVQDYRLSDINLRVAEGVRRLLEAAGAEILMVRETDIPLHALQRVKESAEEAADLHLVIRHSIARREWRHEVFHFPGSTDGEKLCGMIREEIVDLTGNRVDLGEDAGLVLRYTPSPAVVISPRIGQEGGSSTGPLDGFLRLEVLAIYNALLRYFGVEPDDRFEVRGVIRDESGLPLAGALVSLDESLHVRSGREGEFYLRMLDGGEHLLSVESEGYIHADEELFLEEGRQGDIQVVLTRKPDR